VLEIFDEEYGFNASLIQKKSKKKSIPSPRRMKQCLILVPQYAMQSVRKPQRFRDLPISLKMSSTKRVWHNVVGAIKIAGVRILRIFVRTLQTKLTPLDTFFHSGLGSVLKVEMSILDKQSKGIAIDE
jgi:hypothetical protein